MRLTQDVPAVPTYLSTSLCESASITSAEQERRRQAIGGEQLHPMRDAVETLGSGAFFKADHKTISALSLSLPADSIKS